MLSFDEMVSSHISKNKIKENKVVNNSSDDKNIINDESDSDEEPDISEKELTFLKSSVEEYNNLMVQIEDKEKQMKSIKNELVELKKTKTNTHKILLPFMIKKKIDKLEGKSYNLEVKNSSRLKVIDKKFILNCLRTFMNDDDMYDKFITYMGENRERTKYTNLKTSKTKQK